MTVHQLVKASEVLQMNNRKTGTKRTWRVCGLEQFEAQFLEGKMVKSPPFNNALKLVEDTKLMDSIEPAHVISRWAYLQWTSYIKREIAMLLLVNGLWYLVWEQFISNPSWKIDSVWLISHSQGYRYLIESNAIDAFYLFFFQYSLIIYYKLEILIDSTSYYELLFQIA